jgi:hypothetical protein
MLLWFRGPPCCGPVLPTRTTTREIDTTTIPPKTGRRLNPGAARSSSTSLRSGCELPAVTQRAASAERDSAVPYSRLMSMRLTGWLAAGAETRDSIHRIGLTAEE